MLSPIQSNNDGDGDGDGKDTNPRKGNDPNDQGRGGKSPTQKTDNEDAGSGAGGHHEDKNDFSDLVTQVLDELAKGEGQDLLDNNSAMTQQNAENMENADVQEGESLYIPDNCDQDQIHMVRQNDTTKAQAQQLFTEVKEACNFFKSRFRHMMRSLEQTKIHHGVKKGKGLSRRFLVKSQITMSTGRDPKRAYWKKETKIDNSIAAAICLDESGSMDHRYYDEDGITIRNTLIDASKMLMALTEPIDTIGGKVLAYGFRDGVYTGDYSGHRHGEAMIYDIFKTWDEKFVTVKGRFANTRACGGTPMADGIQFGLDNLSTRREQHRILFVLTDGDPNSGHSPIIKRQVRLANEAGIHVIGIGWGRYGKGVTRLYSDHVWAELASEIPQLLVAKLHGLIMSKNSARRGQRMAR